MSKKLDKKRERAMIDLVRSIMYGGDDGNENLIPEVEDLGRILGLYDGVPYMPKANRLVIALKSLKDRNPRVFRSIERLNS